MIMSGRDARGPNEHEKTRVTARPKVRKKTR
jgi:hypothetical protein